MSKGTTRVRQSLLSSLFLPLSLSLSFPTAAGVSVPVAVGRDGAVEGGWQALNDHADHRPAKQSGVAHPLPGWGSRLLATLPLAGKRRDEFAGGQIIQGAEAGVSSASLKGRSR